MSREVPGNDVELVAQQGGGPGPEHRGGAERGSHDQERFVAQAALG
jgi:hypothetical protein